MTHFAKYGRIMYTITSKGGCIMKRFLSMFLVLCFLMFGFNTMAFAQDSTSTETISSTDTQNTDSVDNMQATDTTKTTNTTQSALEYETPMDIGIFCGSAASNDGKIYFTGGHTTMNGILNTLKIYDTNSKTWSIGPSFNQRRYAHLSQFYNGKLYIFGGVPSLNGEILKTLEIYDTATGTWSKGSDMPYPTFDSSSVLVGNKIYVMGGKILDKETISSSNIMQIYDIANDKWSLGNSMPVNICMAVSGTVGSNIYVIAGDYTSSKDGNKICIYNTENN